MRRCSHQTKKHIRESRPANELSDHVLQEFTTSSNHLACVVEIAISQRKNITTPTIIAPRKNVRGGIGEKEMILARVCW